MFQYRVTKYDPALRDSDGAYRVEEWTSFRDIGKRFGGNLFTAEAYARTEDAYVTTVASFLTEAGVDDLAIVGLENHASSHPTTFELQHGAVVGRANVREIVRGLLREQFWCRLERGDGAYVHVGWDYYLYVGVPVPCSGSTDVATSRGLFVEEMASPYRQAAL
jgi:hypothetical protein